MNFGALHSAYFGGELLQRSSDQCAGGNEVRISVPLHHLVGHERNFQPKVITNTLFDVRRNCGVGADGARDLADSDGFSRSLQSFLLSPEFIPPQSEFQAEGHGLRMDTMGAPHHQRVLVANRLLFDRFYRRICFFQQQIRGCHHLQRLPGVEHVGGGHSQMQPPAFRAQSFRDGAKESSYVVACRLEDLHHPGVVVGRRP